MNEKKQPKNEDKATLKPEVCSFFLQDISHLFPPFHLSLHLVFLHSVIISHAARYVSHLFLPSFPFLSAPFAYSIPSCSASVMQLISCVCVLKRHSGDSPGIHQQRHSVVPNTVIVPIQFPTLSCWHDKMPADHTGTIKTHLLCWFRRNPNRHVQVFIVGTVDISATVFSFEQIGLYVQSAFSPKRLITAAWSLLLHDAVITPLVSSVEVEVHT